MDSKPSHDDPGLQMDSVPASHDDPGLQLDSVPASHDDPGLQLDSVPASHDDLGATMVYETAQVDSPLETETLRFCVNCNINITRLRRHPLVIDEIRLLVQQWVAPRQVSSNNLLCHSCWSLAWNEVLNSSNQPATRTVGHHLVCVNCGCSLLRRRSHTLQTNTDRERRIRNIIAEWIIPRQLRSSDEICHPCWLRSDRASVHFTEPSTSQHDVSSESVHHSQYENEETDRTRSTIFLPNYVRAPNTQRHCFFPGCNEIERLMVPTSLRVRLFCDYNYYVPPNCRICRHHLTSNSWELLATSLENPMQTFNALQIEEFASLLKINMTVNLDFNNIDGIPDHLVHYWLGFSKEQYRNLLAELPRLLSKHRGAFALAAYLLKLRTGDSDERIASLLQTPRSTLERLMGMARELIHQDFVPRNLGINHICRAEIARRNLLIPNGLFGGDDRKPIVIADGTYIYVQKSSNYLYQKQTYSLHKYRNLIKPFIIVSSDGYIVDVLGPYPATTSDANIIHQEFNEATSPLREYFHPGDVMILDRGFRDSIPLLERCGYSIYVPSSLEEGETQLSSIEANKSRTVTICRWVVEVVNGIFKQSFKIFRQSFFTNASRHVMIDFSIAASLINRFHTRVTDREDAAQILDIIHQNLYRNNDLADHVHQRHLNRMRADFININVNNENITGFPQLTYNELILIACGTYQLKQARSYYGEHIRFNGSYTIQVCRDRSNNLLEGLNSAENCMLLRAKIQSRHVSRKIYFVYILLNTNEAGRNAIKQYCCNCIVGRRTVGCCAHVMTIIWYLSWARYQSHISPPAQFLDEVLIVYESEHDIL